MQTALKVRCTECKKRKTLSGFYEKKNGKYKAACKVCEIARSTAWANDNPEKRKASSKRWRKNNPERAIEVSQRNHAKRKRLCMEYYGENGGCVCCGETELSFLTMDHIKDNGAEERLRYWMIIRDNFPKGLQTLCFNCQWGKRINKGFCPHRPKKDLRKP